MQDDTDDDVDVADDVDDDSVFMQLQWHVETEGNERLRVGLLVPDTRCVKCFGQ